jgi:chromosome segregation ATPase
MIFDKIGQSQIEVNKDISNWKQTITNENKCLFEKIEITKTEILNQQTQLNNIQKKIEELPKIIETIRSDMNNQHTQMNILQTKIEELPKIIEPIHSDMNNQQKQMNNLQTKIEEIPKQIETIPTQIETFHQDFQNQQNNQIIPMKQDIDLIKTSNENIFQQSNLIFKEIKIVSLSVYPKIISIPSNGFEGIFSFLNFLFLHFELLLIVHKIYVVLHNSSILKEDSFWIVKWFE